MGSHPFSGAEEPELTKLLEKLRAAPPAEAYLGSKTSQPANSSLSFLSPPPQEGDLGTLGPYRVLAELGRGGMGIVLLAYDQELGRTVALKVLPPDRADDKARARFVREARAVAGLDHDNIVPVFAVANPPDGPPYLVMPHIEGQTLAERIKAEGRLDPGAAARICLQVAEGLVAAHKAKLVHRDIKPANIILERARGRARIMDFGLARTTALPGAITQAGTVLGTPHYMSPEQVQAPDRIDERTDVYSLGVTLYEALTGEVPFRGESHLVLQQVLRDDPRPPRRLNDKIARDLETICLHCLDKEPGKRYASAAALAEDLQRFLVGKPIRARPVRASERAVKWARRRPAVATLVASIILVTGLGFAGVVWQWREAEAARREVTDKAEALEIKQREVADKAETLEINLYYKRIALVPLERKRRIGSRADELLDQCPEKLRGWEWHYLKRLPFADLPALGHDTIVTRVAFSPDGLHLASGELNGNVTLWDARTGIKLHTFQAHDHQILALAFSPDGSLLASAARQDRRVKVWNVADRQLVHDLAKHTDSIHALVFSPDGKSLGSASVDRTVRLWDLSSGRELLAFGEHEQPLAINGLAFCADGRGVTSVSVDGVVKVWDAGTGKTVSTQVVSRSQTVPQQWWVGSAAFSSDGRWLALGGENGTVKVYQTDSWQEVRTLEAHESDVHYLAFSPNGRRLASTAEDRTLKLWDVTTGHEALLLDIHSNKITSLAFSPNGHRLASGSGDHTVKVSDGTPWVDFGNGERGMLRPRFTWTAHQHKVVEVAFSPKSKQLISAGWDNTVKVWEIAPAEQGASAPQLLLTVRGLSADLTGVAFSRDGRCFAVASLDGTMTICDAHSGDKICTLQGKGGPVYGVAFNPDSNALASAHYDGSVKVWDIERGRAGKANPLIYSIPAHKDHVFAVAYSADGRLLASAGGRDQENNLGIWEAATGNSIRKLLISPGVLRSVAFDPDGRFLACAAGKCVPLVDVQTGRQLFNAEAADRSFRVVFSPDGRRLVAASEGQTVRLLDSVSGKEIKTLRVSGGELWSVAFSPDGRSLATCSGYKGKGTIQIWDAGAWEK
jgi:WD40 repeat protein